jgi:hypothetical protein
MTTDQHPALSAEPGELPTLTLVLPAGLTSGQALTGLTQAIAHVRGELAARTRQFQHLAAGYATRSDQHTQALCRGQALGSEHAASAIDEAIIEIFDLWPQYEAQLQHQAAEPPATAPPPA